ncbi:FixH family protein [Bacillus sp. ISL-47]|uniref:FixH family protein n=1 Tax=Bacillus sp. ISL-47 TaxID=2819130 RepID=UPI001BED184E|nr:FixH family protein [Bacillus sp. ISL-47]MBT2691054.1 FixH family protein [Bacillus sp. ISL-47]MBT2710851.1 FixH family protein [Pseudomonas sp. ISL-84]
MNRIKYFILPMLLLVFGLTACGDHNAVEEEPQFLEVELSINPEKAEVNEPVVFEAKVTYGEEEVTDADEVKFEIWRANDEEHEKILVEHAEKGIYRLEKSFAVEGTYYIYSHVTARRMHNMPKKEFIIGQPSEPEEDQTNSGAEDMEEMEDTEEHSSH